jgi:hypothetical protein
MGAYTKISLKHKQRIVYNKDTFVVTSILLSSVKIIKYINKTKNSVVNVMIKLFVVFMIKTCIIVGHNLLLFTNI